MKDWPVYLLMVSYGREVSALSIIEDYLGCRKPYAKTKFLVVENSASPVLIDSFNFSAFEEIEYYYHNNRNKAATINFALKELIQEEEALVICIDNDINFNKDFLLYYYSTALQLGNKYYFGSSFRVNLPENLNDEIIPFLQGSARGKADEEFMKMKKLMFLGFSYAFFKSQWKEVKGLDERFSPGSTYGLAAEESVFQKKLMEAGFIPFFIENNEILHKPDPENYAIKQVLSRQENNGYTHAFQDLVTSKQFFKGNYFKRLFFLMRRTSSCFFKGPGVTARMKMAYTKGYFRGLLLYLRIENKKSFLEF